MNRESLKKAIKKIVLNELTQANFGVGKVSTNDDLVDGVKKAVGSAGEVVQNPLNNNVSVNDKEDGKKCLVDITECGRGLYTAKIITNGSDRKVATQVPMEKLIEFLKDSVKEELSYVEKSRLKSMSAEGRDEEKDEKKEEKHEKEEEKAEDKMVETKKTTQKEIGDKATKKATVKPIEEVKPVEEENAPQLGGELVDKIEKIIDRVLSNKNKTNLKADPSKESSTKITVKVKDTPVLKGTEKPIGKPSPKKS